MFKRLILVAAIIGISFSFLYMRVFSLGKNENYVKAGASQGYYNLKVYRTNGNIYDKNMKLLNNMKSKFVAAINPKLENIMDIIPYVIDVDEFNKGLKSGYPFTCVVKSSDINFPEIPVFQVPIRASDEQLAPHLIGYTRDNIGITGIEKAYNDFLTEHCTEGSVRFQMDGTGNILDGLKPRISISEENKAGVVTTIDSDLQEICENAAQKMEKGAIVVLDPYTGKILSSVSVPTFNPNNLELYLDNPDAPLVNRAFSAYSVGSIFKLVTAATALEQGISDERTYECKGFIQVDGQIFKCHKLDGHGIVNMEQAVIESCNTYFIDLSKEIISENFIAKSSALGFGKSNIFAPGLFSAKGNLQNIDEMYNIAEKANLSFGQGKLTATPMQIAGLTAAIVNGGKLPNLSLITGTTINEASIELGKNIVFTNAIEENVSHKLKKFMTETVNNNEMSNARPYNTTAAGKTSTAQTGCFNEDGIEIVNSWFTGFFPAENPKYVVTILVEDGISGNLTAAPIFKVIAENITILDKKRY